MVKTAAAIIMLFPFAASAAGSYISAGLKYSAPNIDARELDVSHPVGHTYAGEKDAAGLEIAIGHQFRSGLYAEISAADLGQTRAQSVASGSDDNFSYQTSVISHQQVYVAALMLGAALPVGKHVALYAEVGATYFDEETSGVRAYSKRDSATNEVVEQSSEQLYAESRRGASHTYGAGLVLSDGNTRIKLGVSQYGGVDRTTVNFVVGYVF